MMKMTTYSVEANFRADWLHHLQQRLKAGGIDASSVDAQDLPILFFNWLHRQIPPQRRTAVLATELTCPDAFKPGLDEIIRKSECGEDLAPHLSKNTKDLMHHDPLLNDWGISHLHLGRQVDSQSGLVERTGPILFVVATEDHLYMIDVMEHGRGHRPWPRQRLLQVIHDNWPDLIRPFRLKGISLVGPGPTDDDIDFSRSAGVTTMVELDGAVYAPIGGGVTTGRLGRGRVGVQVVETSDRFSALVRDAEDLVRRRVEDLVTLAAQDGVQLSTDLRFHFILNGSDVCAFETNHRVLFKLGSLQE